MHHVLSTWPVIGHRAIRIAPEKVRFAMDWLGKHRHHDAHKAQRRHFDHTALKCGVDLLVTTDDRLLKKMSPSEVLKVLPPGHALAMLEHWYDNGN